MNNRPVYTTVSGHRHLDREHQSAVSKMALAAAKSVPCEGCRIRACEVEGNTANPCTCS